MAKTKTQVSVRKRIQRALKQARRRVYAVVEFLMLHLVGFVVPHLSRRMEKRLANGVGSLVFFWGRSSRRIAKANLDIVFGDTKTPEEKHRIMRASYCHAALVTSDYFWFSRDTLARLHQFCHVESESINQWIAGKFPGIFVTAHLGNWELAGQYVASCGRSIWSIYRPIGNEKTLKTLLDFRKSTGQHVIAREGAMTGMLRALRSDGLIALVLDQHTEVVDGGIYVDFFSIPATFSNAPGVLAKRLKTPICVACARHDAATDRYLIKAYDVITPDEIEQMTPDAITERIVKAISQMIVENPEQWLWVYRRWKRYRPHDDPSEFPFYAKMDAYSKG